MERFGIVTANVGSCGGGGGGSCCVRCRYVNGNCKRRSVVVCGRGRISRTFLGRLFMKGVILAGGLGTRLHPLTKVTNKHLLPVYDKPMIYYPLQTLVSSGVTDILIVTGGPWAGEFLSLLGNGKEFGLKHLNYTYQHGEGGIADALSLAEHFAGDQSILLMLGDNFLEKPIKKAVDEFRSNPHGAKIFCTR